MANEALDTAVGELLAEFGEVASGFPKLVIYALEPSQQKVATDAAVSGGAGEFDDVTGGYYDKLALSATIRISDVTPFVPVPGMLVDARGREMRIALNGVKTERATYRLSLVARDGG